MNNIKSFIKRNYKLGISFILGMIVCMGIGVSAVATKEVVYDNSKSGLTSTNLQGAIDELNEKAKVCGNKLCQRATFLHTETCSQTSTSDYCNADGYSTGDTITYGNLGIKGTLITGDAFDCDVNGDGIYNATTERFYYVSDMTNGIKTDSNTAVLIYYNNTGGGETTNSIRVAYDSSGNNNNGLVTGKLDLPTTTQWSNVSLTKTTRAITNELGGTTTSAGDLPTAFSYEGYAARLLTYQEVNKGCYDGTTAITTDGGLSTKCKFLYEDTNYSNSSNSLSYWLETPISSESISAWTMHGVYRKLNGQNVAYPCIAGIRPAIEVLKSNISY